MLSIADAIDFSKDLRRWFDVVIQKGIMEISKRDDFQLKEVTCLGMMANFFFYDYY